MSKMTRRAFFGVAASVGGLVAFSRLRRIPAFIAPFDERADELHRFFGYARQQLGQLLDGVKVRLLPDLNHAVYVHTPSGKVLDSEWAVGGTITYQEKVAREAELAASTGYPSEEIEGRVFIEAAAYTGPRNRLILLNRRCHPDIVTLGHETSHAAMDIDYESLDRRDAGRVRRRDEAIANALGELVLPGAYRREGCPDADVVRAHLLAVKERTSARPGYQFLEEDIWFASRLAASSAPLKEKFLYAREYVR